MNVLYFAWVKEKIGLSEETVTPPEFARLVVAEVRAARMEKRAAGDADLSQTRATLLALQASGADLIELGMHRRA